MKIRGDKNMAKEENEDTSQKERHITKFRILAIASFVQTMLLWYIVYNRATYTLSFTDNTLIAACVVVFYALVFAKRHVRTLVNKVLEW